jgi:hypothetical protein
MEGMVNIRKNVFETNSSSTHSITIGNINSKPLELLKDGILNPQLLIDKYVAYNYEYKIVCYNLEEKLALVTLWILCDRWNVTDEIREELLNIIKEEFNIVKILDLKELRFSSQDDDDDILFDYGYEEEIDIISTKKKLYELINIIKDDSRFISDIKEER